MRCSDFERRLEAFLKGGLTGEERDAALTHLENCTDCHQAARIARGDLDLEPEGSEDFVSTVLEQTSGTSCHRVRSHLCDLVDGVLSLDYSEVMSGHLQNCSECGALFVALTELAEVLPDMALLKPDTSFTADVLAITTSPPEAAFWPTHPIRRLLETMFQRPRFSWEAAYVGTLVIMAIWGGATAPSFANGSSQTLASTHISLRRLADDFEKSLPEKWFHEHTERVRREIAIGYSGWKRSVRNSISCLRRQLYEFQTQSGDFVEQKTEVPLTVVSDRLQDLWEDLPLEWYVEDEPTDQ